MTSVKVLYPYTLFFITEKMNKYLIDQNHSGFIYAYTDAKEIAEKFEQERNMNLFKSKKKDLSKAEIHQLTKQIPKSFLILRKGISKNPFTYQQFDFNIAITMMEEYVCNHICWNILYQKIWENTTVNPCIYKKKYQQALNINMYNECFDVIAGSYSIDEILMKLEPDFLSVFVNQYQELMRK